MVELQLDEMLQRYNIFKILSGNAKGVSLLKGEFYLTIRDPLNNRAYALVDKDANPDDVNLILIGGPLANSEATKILKRVEENKPEITVGRLECSL